MAAERPTPTGPLSPDLTIVESRVYRGPNYWSYEQAIHLVVDLGVLEGYPSDTIPGFTDRLARAAARAETARLLPGPRRGVSSSGSTRARGWATSPSTSRSSCRPRRGTTSRAARPAASRAQPGRYNVIYGYIDETVGLAAGRLAVRIVNDLVAARGRVRLPRGARRLPPAGRADRVRAVDGGHRRGGGQPRHSLDPAQQRVARPARAGRPPAAHPRDDDVEDRGPGRRHRRRQGPHREAARLGRAPGPAPGVGPNRPRGDGRRRADRLPGRGQAARRQPRPRGMPRPPVAGRGREGLRHRARGVEARARSSSSRS